MFFYSLAQFSPRVLSSMWLIGLRLYGLLFNETSVLPAIEASWEHFHNHKGRSKLDASAPNNPVMCWLFRVFKVYFFLFFSSLHVNFEDAAFAPSVHDSWLLRSVGRGSSYVHRE